MPEWITDEKTKKKKLVNWAGATITPEQQQTQDRKTEYDYAMYHLDQGIRGASPETLAGVKENLQKAYFGSREGEKQIDKAALLGGETIRGKYGKDIASIQGSALVDASKERAKALAMEANMQNTFGGGGMIEQPGAFDPAVYEDEEDPKAASIAAPTDLTPGQKALITRNKKWKELYGDEPVDPYTLRKEKRRKGKPWKIFKDPLED